MRYTPEIEAKLLAQIKRTPDKPIVLPDWAYWKDDPAPRVYVGGRPIKLIRHLHELVVGPVQPGRGIINPPHVPVKNVNPLLAVIVPTERSKAVCGKGHPYGPEDYIEGVGHRCQTCRKEKLAGTPNAGEVNRLKKTCPRGHKLRRRSDGRRRCYECPAEQERERRKRKKEEHERDSE